MNSIDNMSRQEMNKRLVEIMGLVIAEWESDPLSVQCFDLNLVAEARELWKKRQLTDM